MKSRDHTELMLNYFGADIKTEGLDVKSHSVENLYAQHITIPGDISMAAYFITAALLVPHSDIIIKNVGVNPTRTGILDVYKAMDAKIEYLNLRSICRITSYNVCYTRLLRKFPELLNAPGSETGPGQVVTWGKSTICTVDAFDYKFQWTTNSGKHIPFDWNGP